MKKMRRAILWIERWPSMQFEVSATRKLLSKCCRWSAGGSLFEWKHMLLICQYFYHLASQTAFAGNAEDYFHQSWRLHSEEVHAIRPRIGIILIFKRITYLTIQRRLNYAYCTSLFILPLCCWKSALHLLTNKAISYFCDSNPTNKDKYPGKNLYRFWIGLISSVGYFDFDGYLAVRIPSF